MRFGLARVSIEPETRGMSIKGNAECDKRRVRGGEPEEGKGEW